MMNRETVEGHCRDIRESIKNKDTFKITCLNYLKNHASSEETNREWAWIGQCLVMSGWITVNGNNDFEVREDIGN